MDESHICRKGRRIRPAAIESNDGACKLGNVWRICDEYRSTASYASKSQGVDAPEGQGIYAKLRRPK